MSPIDYWSECRRRPFVERCEARLVLAHSALTPASQAVIEANEGSELEYVHDHLGLTGAGQTVVVIDTGVAYDHPALGGGFGDEYRVVGGWDFTDENDADPYDDAPAGFHGTLVAGVIASQDAVHTGVAPDVDLVALRVFNDQGVGDFDWIEQALQWVTQNIYSFQHPITTVNLSLGTDWKGNQVPNWAMLEDELAELSEAGLFLTVAAGNDYHQQPGVGLNYPASSPHVVPVASHDAHDTISDFSRRSPRVLVAPGENITSSATDFLYDFNGITDDFLTTSGTSMAAPFVAGASVLVRQAIENSGSESVDGDAIYQILRRTARRVFDPETQVSYHHVDVRAAVESVLGDDLIGPATQQLDRDSVVRLGTVDAHRLTAPAGPSLYRLTAARTGILTVEIDQDQPDGETRLQLLDEEFTPVSSRLLTSTSQRKDLRVRAGDTIYVDVLAKRNATLRLTNLVTVRRSMLHVRTTSEADSVRVDVGGTSPNITVEGTRYDLDRYDRNLIRIDTGLGKDSIHITASTGNDTAWMWPQRIQLVTPDYQIEVNQVEMAEIDSGGGHDLAHLLDSTSRDVFTGLADSAVLQSDHYRNQVNGFASVRGYATSGGGDEAKLFDSSGDDSFIGLPEYSVLSGEGFRNMVEGFADVAAYARLGGDDSAKLYDSSGNDRFYALPDYSVMQRPDGRDYAEGFARVYAYAHRTGSDEARFFDSGGDDLFFGLPQYAVMEGPGYWTYAASFSAVRAYAQRGGNDTARLFGSDADDTFVGLPSYSVLSGIGYRNYVDGFAQVRAYAHQGGFDRARLYGSASHDLFYGLPDYSVLTGPTYENYAQQFENVRVDVGQGGYDEARLFDSVGNDVLYGAGSSALLVGPAFQISANHFDLLLTHSRRGGTDHAEILGSQADRVFDHRRTTDLIFGVCYDSPVTEENDRDRQNAEGGWVHGHGDTTTDGVLPLERVSAAFSAGAIDAEAFLEDVSPGDRILVTDGFSVIDYLLQEGADWF